ncbi:MAG: DUF3800 domain-containing protein [Gammaproteobacteria bacterium]|nr:DUF3800 domain-containing protein [Gammaproteobacteria bacterium]
MYLLYLDDSGSVKNPGERYFVLAGISVFERQIYHLITSADAYVATIDPLGEAELHGSVMNKGGRSPWKGMPRKERLAAIEGGLNILRDAHNSVRAFAVAVDKRVISPDDPVEYAFEELCNRFNLYLSRLWSREGKKHRGLVVMDETHYEGTLQGLAGRFRERGTRWGSLRNMAEVPLFVDSRASRLIQIADLLAWAVWRRYEFSDTRYFDRIVSRFDTEGGVIHGLVHRKGTDECYCPACMSRSARDSN